MSQEARKNILIRISKQANQNSVDSSEVKVPVLLPRSIPKDSADAVFANNFTQNGGLFFYCENKERFFEALTKVVKERKWYNVHCWNPELTSFFQNRDFRLIRIGHILDKAHAGLTTCEFIIAENGSIMVSSALSCGRMLPIYPPNWLVIASVAQLCETQKEAWNSLAQKHEKIPTMISVIQKSAFTQAFTGETLKGGIGPEKIYLFLVEEMWF